MYDISFNNVNDPCSTSLRKKNILSKDRNQKWLKKLPDIIKSRSTLIAVGCLHLPGEEGLLCQLSKMGYTVQAVK